MSPIVNVSLVLNSVEVELEINNYDEKNVNKCREGSEENKSGELTEIDSRDSGLDVGLSGVESSIFDTTNFKIQINDPMKQSKVSAISPEIGDELMDNYLNYVYGINIENPNLKLSFGSSIDDNLSQNQYSSAGLGLNKGLDMLGIEVPNSVRKASFGSITSNSMGAHFSAVNEFSLFPIVGMAESQY